MTFNSDRFKSAMGRAGELKSIIEKAVSDHAKRVASALVDDSRSQLWKDAQIEESGQTFKKIVDPALGEVEQLRQEALAVGRQYLDPLIAIYGQPVAGLEEGFLTVDRSGKVIADALLKQEFRELLKAASEEDRKGWYDRLTGEKDWGRLGVLIGLDPKLKELAMGLDLPGRDDALKNASLLRKYTEGVLRSERARVGEERIEELSAKADGVGLTSSEQLEIIKLGTAKASGWRTPAEAPEDPKPRITEEEKVAYAALNAKSNAGPLTKAEGLQLVSLAGKLDPPAPAAVAK